jgi:hypothetical protein
MANSYDMDNCTAYARTLRLSILRLDQAREVLTRSEKEPLIQHRMSRSSSLPKSVRIDPGMRLVICPAKSYDNSRSFAVKPFRHFGQHRTVPDCRTLLRK